VEGPTDDPEVLRLRARQQRNFLATLMLCQGVPMLLHGDEMGRTQGGNNNAYCQDNATSWFDWSPARRGDPLLPFTQSLVRLRRELPVLRQDAWLTGTPDADGRRDITWYSVWGLEMTAEEWPNPAVRCVAAVLDARFVPAAAAGQGRRSVLLVFNATGEDATFTLPVAAGHPGEWLLRIATHQGHIEEPRSPGYAPAARLRLPSHSMALLTQQPQE
jgi:glycogen operon protein